MKTFKLFVVAMALCVMMTGCGGKPNTNATTQTPAGSPAAQESTTQGSGEESANSNTTETPTNQSNATSVAVDPAPYWQDDNYFDMYGYLEACGCKVMFRTVVDGDFHTADAYSSSAVGCSIFFEESASHPNDSSASLLLYYTNGTYNGNCLAVSYYDSNDRYHDEFTPLTIFDNQRDIVIDQYGNTLDIHTITQIEMLINKLYATQYHGESAEYMATFFDDYNQN